MDSLVWGKSSGLKSSKTHLTQAFFLVKFRTKTFMYKNQQLVIFWWRIPEPIYCLRSQALKEDDFHYANLKHLQKTDF